MSNAESIDVKRAKVKYRLFSFVNIMSWTVQTGIWKVEVTEALAFVFITHAEFCFLVDLELEKILKEKRHQLVFDSNDLEELCRGVENVFKYERGSNNNFLLVRKEKNGVFDGEMKCFFHVEKKKKLNFVEFTKCNCVLGCDDS